VNLDMVGRPIDPGKRQIVVEHDPGLRVLTNDEASRSWANRLAAQVELAGLKVKEGPIFGSDYIPFEAAGYPCVGLFDGADEQPFYHTGDDRPEAVDTGYTARAAGAVIGLILGDEARR
jgi:Zn-dependent M28 family amino/carboxypeptidase